MIESVSEEYHWDVFCGQGYLFDVGQHPPAASPFAQTGFPLMTLGELEKLDNMCNDYPDLPRKALVGKRVISKTNYVRRNRSRDT